MFKLFVMNMEMSLEITPQTIIQKKNTIGLTLIDIITRPNLKKPK